MAANGAENEGVRLLDEFVCNAVRFPCVLAPESTRVVASGGENEGMRISKEAESSCRPQAMEEPRNRYASVSESQLRSLSTAELLGLVRQVSSEMPPSKLALIQEIVHERLARCRDEIALGDELIATCKERAGQTGNEA